METLLSPSLHQLYTYQLISHRDRQCQDQDLFPGNFIVQKSLESGTRIFSSFSPLPCSRGPPSPVKIQLVITPILRDRGAVSPTH